MQNNLHVKVGISVYESYDSKQIFSILQKCTLFMVRHVAYMIQHTLCTSVRLTETHQKEIASTILNSSLWHTPSTIDIDISIGASSHHMYEASPRKSSIYSAILKGGDILAKVPEKVLWIHNSKPVNVVQVSFTMGFIALGQSLGAGSRGANTARCLCLLPLMQ